MNTLDRVTEEHNLCERCDDAYFIKVQKHCYKVSSLYVIYVRSSPFFIFIVIYLLLFFSKISFTISSYDAYSYKARSVSPAIPLHCPSLEMNLILAVVSVLRCFTKVILFHLHCSYLTLNGVSKYKLSICFSIRHYKPKIFPLSLSFFLHLSSYLQCLVTAKPQFSSSLCLGWTGMLWRPRCSLKR